MRRYPRNRPQLPTRKSSRRESAQLSSTREPSAPDVPAEGPAASPSRTDTDSRSRSRITKPRPARGATRSSGAAAAAGRQGRNARSSKNGLAVPESVLLHLPIRERQANDFNVPNSQRRTEAQVEVAGSVYQSVADPKTGSPTDTAVVCNRENLPPSSLPNEEHNGHGEHDNCVRSLRAGPSDDNVMNDENASNALALLGTGNVSQPRARENVEAAALCSTHSPNTDSILAQDCRAVEPVSTPRQAAVASSETDSPADAPQGGMEPLPSPVAAATAVELLRELRDGVRPFLSFLEKSGLDRHAGYKVSLLDRELQVVFEQNGTRTGDVTQQMPCNLPVNDLDQTRWTTATAERVIGFSLGQCPEILRDLLNLSCQLCVSNPFVDQNGNAIANTWHALQCPCVATFVYMFPSLRPKGLRLASPLNGSIISHGFSAIVSGLTEDTPAAYCNLIALGCTEGTSNVEPCDLLLPLMKYFLHPDSTKRGETPTPFALNVAEACGRRWNATGNAVESTVLGEHLAIVLGVPAQKQTLTVKLLEALAVWRVTRNNAIVTIWGKHFDPSKPVNETCLGKDRFKAASRWYGAFHRLDGKAENLPMTCNVFWAFYDRVFGVQSVEESARLSLISFVTGSLLGQFVNTENSRPLNFAMTSGNRVLGSAQRSKVQRKSDLSSRLQMLIAADLSYNGTGAVSDVPIERLPFTESWTVVVGLDGPGQVTRVIRNDIPEHSWGKMMQAVAVLGPQVFAPTQGAVPMAPPVASYDAPV